MHSNWNDILLENIFNVLFLQTVVKKNIYPNYLIKICPLSNCRLLNWSCPRVWVSHNISNPNYLLYLIHETYRRHGVFNTSKPSWYKLIEFCVILKYVGYSAQRLYPFCNSETIRRVRVLPASWNTFLSKKKI